MLVFILLISLHLLQADEFNTERLPIGNPKTKYNYCAVKLNQILKTGSNSNLSLDQFIEAIRKHRIVLVGETHTNFHHHDMQLKIIKGLIEKGQSVCLALEMFTPRQDSVLNAYIQNKIDQEEFLEKSDFYNVWGHNYRYYKPIFDLARENDIQMYGINMEKKYVSKIARNGIQSLSKKERDSLPTIDTTNVQHRFYIKTAMEGLDAIQPNQFQKLYAAQCFWDAAMGTGAIKVAHENPGATVIVLAGSGHVAYNLGIGRVIEKASFFSYASVIAVDVPDTLEESLMMHMKKSIQKQDSLTKKQKMPPTNMMGSKEDSPHKIVIRSLADFLWGVPKETQEKYPSLGFHIDNTEQGEFKVIRVFPESIADTNRIEKGDIILAVDGQRFSTLSDLKYYLSLKNWGDSITFEIARDSENVEVQFEINEER